MKTNFSIQPELFEGMEKEASTLVRELLESRLHPVVILNEAIIPAVEASATALKTGSFPVTRLPAFGKSLQAVLEMIEASLHHAGLSLHFRLGRACDDVFDLWGTVIAGIRGGWIHNIEEFGIEPMRGDYGLHNRACGQPELLHARTGRRRGLPDGF